MDKTEQLDHLLEAWDDCFAKNPSADLNDFIRKHGSDLDDRSIAQFNKMAAALSAMNRRLDSPQETVDVAAETNDTPQLHSLWKVNGQADRCTPRPADARGVSIQLTSGFQPIPGYKLVEQLGIGGFGEVWKATDTNGFSVAIKFVKLEGKLGELELRSLDVIRDVRHPHLLTIFGTRQIDNLLVIAMELADRTLLERFEEATKEGFTGIPQDELLVYMSEAAEGIDFLNDPGSSGRHRIQHRDIKPQNLLLSGNSVKIGDFGLAQSLRFNVAEASGLTVAYAAPEFFEGNTTSRSDQYSLAVTYCFLRGGRVPFVGTPAEIMEAHGKHPPDLAMLPPSEHPAVSRALSEKSKDRWPSCTAFVRQLGAPDNVKKLSDGSSPPQSEPGTTTNRSTLAWLWTGVAVLPLLILVCWLSGLFPTPEQAPDAGAEQPQPNGIGTTQIEANDRPRIAVLYFENESEGEKDLDALAKGLCSMMITRLDAKREYDLVERERLQEVLDEMKLTRSAMFDQKDVAKIGNLVGARLLVLGSYFQILNIFRIDARLVDVETGITVAAAGAEGKSDEFSVLLSQLVDQLVQRHQGVDGPQLQKGNTEHPKDEDAAKVSLRLASDLGVAVNAYDRGEVETAIATINAIIEANPDFEEATKLHKQWGEVPHKSKNNSEGEETRVDNPK